ncbi:MAG: HAD-IC family P-type ATPase, partial [Gemmataceae bacterium]
GVSAVVGTAAVLVGNRRLMAARGVTLGDEVEALLARLEQTGQTALIVAVDGTVAGVIGARDRLRPEAKEVVEELRRLGVGHVVMLTGDRASAAKPVADAVHVLDVRAELLPTDKAAIVAQLPGKVAMVGDGVNDAPALARAHVGLAIGGTGIDVAADAGDVVLMIGPGGVAGERPRSPLKHLPMLLRLSRETVRIIRQNVLVFAFGVNLVGVLLTSWLWPVIAPGYVDQGPLAAVLYHQIGSLLVLLNSMRLLWFERGGWDVWLKGWDRRLDARFDLDEALHAASHRWREILGGLAAAGLVTWGLSGAYQVGPDEVGVVRRFGRVLPGTLEPGLHVRWPWPAEVVDRVRPGAVRTVELGFRFGPGSRQGSRSWSSEHGSARDADEAVVMTGDGSLLEVQASVLYTVADPAVYLFDAARPDDAIRDAAEGVLREAAGGRPMGSLLTTGRAAFQNDVARRLRERLADLHPYSLGVRLEGFALHDVHPPTDVVQSYHEVARARQRREQMVNQAKASALASKRRQEAEGLHLVRRAEAERYERIAQAEARRAEFTARLSARRLSWADEAELFGALLSGTLDGPGYAAARRARAESNAALTDFRLYWESLSAALSGRPKFLIDSDKLPGRRTLWLVPPPPAPVLPSRPSPPREEPNP